jgi:hypothetical protein
MIRPSAALTAIALLTGCSSAGVAFEGTWSVPFAIVDETCFGECGASLMVAVGRGGDVALAGQFALDSEPVSDDSLLAVLYPDGVVDFAFDVDDGGASEATGVVFDADGDVVICGSFRGSLPTPHGHVHALAQDTFVAAFDLAGKNLWTRHFSADLGGPSGAGSSSPSGVSAAPDGTLVIAGQLTGTFGLGGPPLDTGPDTSMTFVAKLDRLGLFLWQVGLGGHDNQATALAIDGAGNVVVAGSSQGEIVVGGQTFEGGGTAGPLPFIVGSSPRGVPLWAVQIGGDTASITALGVDGAGDVLAAGSFSGEMIVGSTVLSSAGSSDAFVLELSPDGRPLWVEQFGDYGVSNTMSAGALAVTGGGHVLVTGTYSGAPRFGPSRLPFGGDGSMNDASIFLGELDRHGTPVARAFGDDAPPAGAGTGLALASGGGILLTGELDGAYDFGSGAIGDDTYGYYAGNPVTFVAELPPILLR